MCSHMKTRIQIAYRTELCKILTLDFTDRRTLRLFIYSSSDLINSVLLIRSENTRQWNRGHESPDTRTCLRTDWHSQMESDYENTLLIIDSPQLSVPTFGYYQDHQSYESTCAEFLRFLEDFRVVTPEGIESTCNQTQTDVGWVDVSSSYLQDNCRDEKARRYERLFWLYSFKFSLVIPSEFEEK